MEKKSLFNVKLIILRAADVGHRKAFGTIDLYVTYDANVRLVHDSHCCKTKVRFLQALHVVLYVTPYDLQVRRMFVLRWTLITSTRF